MLTPYDRAIIDQVDTALRRGLQMRDWYDQRGRTDANWFPVAQTFNPGDRFEGMFGEVPIDGKPVKVMGAYQDIFFDRPRAVLGDAFKEHAAHMRAGMAEFVLKYYLRLSETASFARVVEPRPPLPRLLDWFSWRPENRGTFGPSITLPKHDGIEFRQLYFKRKDTGEVAKFPEEEILDIVDLRTIGVAYDWVILEALILNSDVTFAPLGRHAPQARIPARLSTYLVLDSRCIEQVENADGSFRFGFTLTMLKTPGKSVMAYGLGHFEEAMQINRFVIDTQSVARAQFTLLGNQFTKMFDIFGFDPLTAYIGFMKTVTGGWSERQLDISDENVTKFILFNHCTWIYHALMQSYRTFHQVPDWLDPSTFPDWVRDKVRAEHKDD